MKIKVLKSNEIDKKLWVSITDGFNESFDRNKKTSDFIEYYHNTILNYSFHALAFSETGELGGSNTIIPHLYNVNNNKSIFGVSGGTFVREKFRGDIFVYKDMMDALIQHCKVEGLKAIYGVPNKNSLGYTTKFLKFDFITNLNYYVVPLRIGSIIKLPLKSFFDSASNAIFSVLIGTGKLISKFKKDEVEPKPIHIDFTTSFIEKRFNKGYKFKEDDNFFVIYKLSKENGIHTAFLMEYREENRKSYKSFIRAINMIKKTEKVDIIVYIGTIHHCKFGTFKVPNNKQPQLLSLAIKSLDDNKHFNEFILQKDNWDFSLVNYDVR